MNEVHLHEPLADLETLIDLYALWRDFSACFSAAEEVNNKKNSAT